MASATETTDNTQFNRLIGILGFFMLIAVLAYSDLDIKDIKDLVNTAAIPLAIYIGVKEIGKAR